jgi:hypothetical protein
LRTQRRSRAVPRQSKVIAARLAMMAPKNKKMPIAVNPGVLGSTARCRVPQVPILHLGLLIFPHAQHEWGF